MHLVYFEYEIKIIIIINHWDRGKHGQSRLVESVDLRRGVGRCAAT